MFQSLYLPLTNPVVTCFHSKSNTKDDPVEFQLPGHARDCKVSYDQQMNDGAVDELIDAATDDKCLGMDEIDAGQQQLVNCSSQ